MIKEYEVYLSTDGKTWGQPVVSSEFKNTSSLQVAKLKKVTTGRYLKLVAKSEINGKAWSSAAEIGIQCESEPTAVNQAVASIAKSDEDTFYDLQGRKVSSPEKGNIYIQNGVGGSHVDHQRVGTAWLAALILGVPERVGLSVEGFDRRIVL